MAINYFIGWSVDELRTELRAAQEDLAAGKSITRSGAGEASFENQVEKSIESRIQLLLQALNKLDPATYPIDQVTAIDRVKISFA